MERRWIIDNWLIDRGFKETRNENSENWKTLFSNTESMLNSIWFTDANTGYAVGDGGTITIELPGISNFRNTGISVYDLKGQLLLREPIVQ